MSQHEILINRILSTSGIAGRGRRCDVACEMRSHIEEIIEDERAAGHNEKEIEQLVALRFGQPEEIADEFATVYRPQRITLSVLSYSLLAVISVFAVAAFVYTVQYGATLWLGFPPAPVFNRGHVGKESAILVGLTVGYLSIYFAERLFTRQRFAKAFGLIGIAFVAIAVSLELLGVVGAEPLFAGFLFAAFVRAMERIFAHSALRLAGVLIFFAVVAKLAPYLMTCTSHSLTLLFLPICMAIAVSSQFVGYFAGIFDREILKKHFA